MNLITGYTGFIGGWLAKKAPKGESLIMTRHVELFGSPNKIFHCAWANDPLLDYKLTKEVINFANKKNSLVILMSSGAAKFDDTEYAESKRRCEQLAKEHIILRLYSFIGPGLKKHAPYEFLKKALNKEDIIITGTGNIIRSYMYAEDMANEIWKINKPGLYEIGSNIPVSINELAHTIGDMCEVSVKTLNKEKKEPHPIYIPEKGFSPRPLIEQLVLMKESMKNE